MSDWLKHSTLRGLTKSAIIFGLTPIQKFVSGPILSAVNKRKPSRYLEIGPGPKRLEGFETFNITGGPNVDYVGDATRGLPFEDNSFDLLYASHILEHVAWYKTDEVLREWVRVLKPGGSLEIWVPNGLKIAKAFVDAETTGAKTFHEDNWWRFNEQKDPTKWMAGRIFSYGDGSGRQHHFNWHLAFFSERYLKQLLTNAGLTDVIIQPRDKVRGFDHGWINLGVRGTKPNTVKTQADQSEERQAL